MKFHLKVLLHKVHGFIHILFIVQDNVTLELDGVLYFKVVNPYKASYGVEDAEFAISQLAQTTMVNMIYFMCQI